MPVRITRYTEQRLDAGRVILLEEVPLGCREAKIVMAVVARDATPRYRFEFFMFRRGVHHQRGIKLLQHVAISLQKHREEFEHVVRDQVHFHTGSQTGDFDGLLFRQQPHHLFRRQDVRAAQVVVGIRRGKAIQMRPADGCE
jgi:hypothetical protein